MDTDEMVRMAKEREGWHLNNPSRRHDAKVKIADGWCIHCGTDEHANFIALAPRTILALAEEVARLQADNERLQEQARHADKRAAKYEAQMDYVESRNVLLGEWIDGGILPNQEAFYPVLAPAIGYYNKHLKAWLVNLTLQDAAFWKDTPADFPEALSLPAPQPSPDHPHPAT